MNKVSERTKETKKKTTLERERIRVKGKEERKGCEMGRGKEGNRKGGGEKGKRKEGIETERERGRGGKGKVVKD